MKKIALLAASSLLAACSLTQQSVSGVYQGELPCADCSKIQAKLTLNAAKNSYQYDTLYFKDGKVNPFSEKGTFKQDPTKQGVIVLDQGFKFKVSSQQVELLDSEGNSVHSKHNYVLKKVAQ